MHKRRRNLMSLSDDFNTFTTALIPTNLDDMDVTIKGITKKLNLSYYDSSSEEENIYVVGSVGRHTATNGVSDLDIIFDMPNSIYNKYDNYGGNGQSALLQNVKNTLKEKYSRTKMRGDGQVVVIEFTNYTVELVPGFKKWDDSFEYPDTHDGGKWRTTNPLPEINESVDFNSSTWNDNFWNACRMMREWRNKQGFIFGGLLIDTLCHQFFTENVIHKYANFNSYLDLIKDLFSYLKDLNKDQDYWDALGSNEKVYNTGDGKFADEAKKAYDTLNSYDSKIEDLNSVLRSIFGVKFPKSESAKNSFDRLITTYNADYNEQFIESIYPVNIQYALKIDCDVIQNGFRENSLRYMLSMKFPLLPGKTLKFSIASVDNRLHQPYDIIWKVKNQGEEAVKRNQIRGQLIHGKGHVLEEKSNFRGSHFVECYIIKDGLCVARNRIDVPIKPS